MNNISVCCWKENFDSKTRFAPAAAFIYKTSKEGIADFIHSERGSNAYSFACVKRRAAARDWKIDKDFHCFPKINIINYFIQNLLSLF